MPFTSLRSLLATLTGTALLACPSDAATIFTETFSSDAANWKIDSPGTTNATWVGTGGPLGAGDAYISRAISTTGVVLRAQDEFNSSNHGFEGNWITTGVATFSIDLFQDTGSSLTLNLRFADPANSPGASTANFTIASGVWTNIVIPIVDSVSPSPGAVFQSYGGSAFATIFDNIGHVQISAVAPVLSGNLGIDNPTISSIPEPTSLTLLGTGICGLLGRRRRK